MFNDDGAVAASTGTFNSLNRNGGYSINGGAGVSLAARGGSRKRRQLKLHRARGGVLVNADAKTFTPLSDFFVDPSGNFPGFPGTGTRGSGGSGSGTGGFDWSQVFGVITQAAPAIISAARGQGVPAGYYPGAVQQGQQGYPQGYYPGEAVNQYGAANAGALAGQGLANLGNSVSTFVSSNPLLVLGGTVALLLLFKSPPSRR